MGRATWIDADGTKRGEWTEEEDKKLVAYIDEYGIGDWRFIPDKAGLRRCGKSCRLRWLNYLRPGIKKDRFSPQEEQLIIDLHSVVGNRWAAIAQQMPNRSDNDIKNHWNSCLKKRLERNGIDPMTHKPIINNHTIKTTSFKTECISSSSTASPSSSSSSSSSSVSARLLNKIATGISSRNHCIDSIKNILSVSRNTSVSLGQEEALKNDPDEMIIAKNDPDEMIIAKDDQEEMWENEEMRRFMEEIGVIEFETTSYDRVYNSSFDFSSSPYSVNETDLLLDDHCI